MRIITLLLAAFLVGPASGMSPSNAVTEALADLDAQNNVDQPFYRYLYLPNPESEAAFLPALRLHVNLISRESAMAYPKRVAPGLWRVDIRERHAVVNDGLTPRIHLMFDVLRG